MPTRNGRNAMLFTSNGVINIDNKKWEKDFSPIDDGIDCEASNHYSKAYLRHLIKSKEVSLYKNGKINKENMNRCNISMGDLMEGVRIEGNVTSLDEVKEVYMERNGEISVIKKS